MPIPRRTAQSPSLLRRLPPRPTSATFPTSRTASPRSAVTNGRRTAGGCCKGTSPSHLNGRAGRAVGVPCFPLHLRRRQGRPATGSASRFPLPRPLNLSLSTGNRAAAEESGQPPSLSPFSLPPISDEVQPATDPSSPVSDPSGWPVAGTCQ